MVKGLYTAHTGMVNEMKRLDIMTNNLANSETTGYKKEGTTSRTFADEYAIRVKDTSSYGLATRIGSVSLGTHLGEVYTDWSEGSYKVTDKSTDLAIEGQGFFSVAFTDKAGNTTVKLTRDGSFTLDKDGYLRTKDGDYVLNATGSLNRDPSAANRIQLNPQLPFEVNELGYIFQNDVVVGTVGVVDVTDYNYISKYGENLYDLEQGGAVVAADAYVQQGMLEASNVNVINEMVNMITIQRAYEAGQKVITSIDSTLETATSQVGKV